MGFWSNRFPASDYSSGYVFNSNGLYLYFTPVPKPKGSLYFGSAGRWRVSGNQLEILVEKNYYWSHLISTPTTKDVLVYKSVNEGWIPICDFSGVLDQIKLRSYTVIGNNAPFMLTIKTQIDDATLKDEKYVYFSMLNKLDVDAKAAYDRVGHAIPDNN
jgi:hypothetical protein